MMGRIDRIALLLAEQGRLLAERKRRQDFFAAALRSRRLAEISEELKASEAPAPVPQSR